MRCYDGEGEVEVEVKVEIGGMSGRCVERDCMRMKTGEEKERARTKRKWAGKGEGL